MRTPYSRIPHSLILLAVSGCFESGLTPIMGIGGGDGGGGNAPVASIDFFTEPGSTTEGQVISPAVEVVARDSIGQTDSSFTGTMTVSLTSNSTGAAFSGTTTRRPVNGIASFNDLRVDTPGTYTLTANTSGVPAVTSAQFTITAVNTP